MTEYTNIAICKYLNLVILLHIFYHALYKIYTNAFLDSIANHNIKLTNWINVCQKVNFHV